MPEKTHWVITVHDGGTAVIRRKIKLQPSYSTTFNSWQGLFLISSIILL
jgi:hypothetical protein